MEIVLIRGMPGSGKTTIAKSMTTHVHCEADQFFETPEGYRFDASKLNLAHNFCQDKAEAALHAGDNVVVANTFTQKWEMVPYYDLASKYGADIRVVVATGHYSSVHDVPEEVMERMKMRWQD